MDQPANSARIALAGTRRPLPSYRMRALHLTAVWAFSVSQPLISLLDGNREILVAQNATRLDAFGVLAFFALVPPLLATGYAWVASRVSPWIGDVVYLSLFGAFLVPFALQLEKRFEPGALVALALAGSFCVGATLLYRSFRAAQLFCGWLIVLPLIGLVSFGYGLPSLSGEAHARGFVFPRTPAPVVMLVFDEFPVQSLMTRSGSIDAIRYPNFARLAREGTWYPNAATVNDGTEFAVPAVVAGLEKRRGTLPIAANYPNNLFSALEGSYALDIHEAGERLCPRTSCPQYDAPAFTRWKRIVGALRWPYVERVLPASLTPAFRDVDFERVQGGKMEDTLTGFEGFLRGFTSVEPIRSLHYAHVLVPHSPWRFTPGGVEYNFDGRDGLVDRSRWAVDPWPALQAQQQHLLQVGFTDKLLGRLLARLDRLGLYDRALIVVVADHGISFKPGSSYRWIEPANIDPVSNVPLFVKYPHERAGRVDSRNASVVDIVPTVADVLDMDLPYEVDGVSLLGPASNRRIIAVEGRAREVVRTTYAKMIEHRREALRLKDEHFGEGADSLYAVGKSIDLLGTRAPEVGHGPTRVHIENGDLLAAVDPGSKFVPMRIMGEVRGSELPKAAELAVAVNGRIRALTYPIAWQGDQVFGALVPPEAFREGFNRVDVYEVEGSGTSRRVVWLGSNTSTP